MMQCISGTRADIYKSARNLLQIQRKVLSPHLRRDIQHLVPGLPGNLFAEISPDTVVDRRRRPRSPMQLCLSSGRSGNAFNDSGHLLRHAAANFFIISADGSFQLHPFGQHVPGMATVDPGDTQHYRLPCAALAADDGLERGNDLRRRHDRVHPIFRSGGMCAYPFHRNFKTVDTCR
ncbi:hypothetical protein D3C75_1021620 [compost metagenome]